MSIEALREKLVAAGTTKRDQVIILIEQCLREGMVSGPAILQRLIDLGYNGKFVGIQLSMNEGPRPESYRWVKDYGEYRLHPGSTEEN